MNNSQCHTSESLARLRRYYSAVLGASALVITSGLSCAATLNAVIVSDRGRPVSSVVVNLQRVGEGAPITQVAKTDEGGKITVDLPDGIWALCTSSPAEALLDSCQWTDALPTVRSGSSNARSAITVVLHTGALLKFRIEVPVSLLRVPPEAGGAHVNVGAFTTKGHYHAAQRVSEDAAGWDYELLVPSVADLTVSVIAFNAQALDAAGKGVTGATPESFRVRAWAWPCEP